MAGASVSGIVRRRVGRERAGYPVVAGVVYVFVRAFAGMLQASALEVARAREQATVALERQRIAREMHDGVAQALFYLTILVVTGSYAALLQLPDVSPSTGSPYGRAPIMKLAMGALMLPIGAINLIDRGRDPFSRMVAAELLLALGVYVATGFLTTLPPPEAGSP